jgi:uncharacterized protein YndB with AHSA1/START domain
MLAPITVSVVVPVGVAKAWHAFTDANAIQAWNFASPDWQCPSARLDLRAGGEFSYRMEAKDGSMGFDYEGTFVEVTAHERILMSLGPDREVVAEFVDHGDSTQVKQTFTPDREFPVDMQRAGWQAILDNYKAYVTSVGA